jgi:hypothetical protein
VDKVVLEQVFLQVLQFPHQYHSTAVPHTLVSSGERTMGLLVAQFHRDIVSPHWNNKK